jgi:hypothetical protein
MPDSGLLVPAGTGVPAAVAAAEAPAIGLSQVEQGVDTATAARLALGEHELRRELATGVQRVFVIGNLALWTLVMVLVCIDVVLVATGIEKPGDRIVDQGVVKTLVYATVVQVGVIMLTISKYLFPGAPSEIRPWWKVWD